MSRVTPLVIVTPDYSEELYRDMARLRRDIRRQHHRAVWLVAFAPLIALALVAAILAGAYLTLVLISAATLAVAVVG